MNEYRRNLLVGFFMLASLGAGATLMMLFGEHPTWLGGAEYEIAIRMERVSGVPEGTPINMNGVEVGRIGRLEFRDVRKPHLGVNVIALIKNRYDIPKGTYAEFGASPFGLGRSNVEFIVPAMPEGMQASPMLPHAGATIEGVASSVLDPILPPTMLPTLEGTAAEIKNLAAELQPVARDLHHLFEKVTVREVDEPQAAAMQNTATLYTVVERFDQTLQHWNALMGDPEFQQGMRDTVSNVREITAQWKVTSENIRRTSDTFDADLDRVSTEFEAAVKDTRAQIARIGTLLDGLAELTKNLNAASEQLARGEGTAGLMLRDPQLYEELLISIQRFTDLVDTFRRMAAKFEQDGYIHLKVETSVGPVKKDVPIPEVPASRP